MKLVFVDTLYWIATIHPKDQWHDQALEVGSALTSNQVTTDAVLIEVLNFFCGYGPEMRQQAAGMIEDVLADADIETIQLTHTDFLAGIALYKSRPDKGYSLTDCISMNVMRERSISDVLTHDDHFTQEGFKVLL